MSFAGSPKESELDFFLIVAARFAKKLSGRKVASRPVRLHLKLLGL